MPRVFGKLEVFGQLPPITGLLMGYFGMPSLSVIAIPEFARAFESFYKASQALLRHVAANAEYQKDMVDGGFPCSAGAITLAPFDVISDALRGMKGTMLDMYRRPQELLKLIDYLTPNQINSAISLTKMTGNPGVFIPLHRGADGFMSLKQFETFYWPSLKNLLLTLIDNGLTPCPFFEGDYTMRLKYLAELPKGKILGLFDATDIYKAKERLDLVRRRREILRTDVCWASFSSAARFSAGSVQRFNSCGVCPISSVRSKPVSFWKPWFASTKVSRRRA